MFKVEEIDSLTGEERYFEIKGELLSFCVRECEADDYSILDNGGIRFDASNHNGDGLRITSYGNDLECYYRSHTQPILFIIKDVNIDSLKECFEDIKLLID